jgi:hypothetical protein
MTRPVQALLVAATVLVGAAGCSDDDTSGATTTTSARAGATTTTLGGADPGLDAVLLEATDLPAAFEPAAEVDDTITSFCATHDAAAGLQASERAVAGFARTGGGASVIQLAFRFDGDGAAAFVAQAEAAMATCSGVPDGSGTGLAFEYEPLSPAVAEVLADAGDARTSGFGTSVGSGSLTVAIGVVQRGEVATLVAVLGLDEPRPALDELTATAFAAVVERLNGSEASRGP